MHLTWRGKKKKQHLGWWFSLPKRSYPELPKWLQLRGIFWRHNMYAVFIPCFSNDQVRWKEIGYFSFTQSFMKNLNFLLPKLAFIKVMRRVCKQELHQKYAQGSWRVTFCKWWCLTVSLWKKYQKGNVSWSLRFLNMSIWVTKDFYAPFQTLFKHCYSCKHATQR